MISMKELNSVMDRPMLMSAAPWRRRMWHEHYVLDVDEFLMWNIQRMHEITIREEQEELDRVDQLPDSDLTLEQEQEPENQTKEEPSEAELRRAVEGADYSPEESAENLRCMEELRQELMSPNIDADLQCFNPVGFPHAFLFSPLFPSALPRYSNERSKIASSPCNHNVGSRKQTITKHGPIWPEGTSTLLNLK